MSVGSPTAGTWFSSQWRPDNEFETDRSTAVDSSRVPIGSGQLTADPRRIHCHEPDIVQYVNFFSTLLELKRYRGAYFRGYG